MRCVADVVPPAVVPAMERSVAACLTGGETGEGVEWLRAAWVLGLHCGGLLDEELHGRLIVAWISGWNTSVPVEVAEFAPQLAAALRAGWISAVQLVEVVEQLCRTGESPGDLSTIRTADGSVFLAEVVAR